MNYQFYLGIDMGKFSFDYALIDKEGKAMETKNLKRLELLLSHRDRLVRNLMSIGNTLKEEEGFIDPELHEEMEQISRPAIEAVKASLAEFNRRYELILKEDIELCEQAKIVTSIPGFGNVIASKIIIATHGFT